jgi:hypothetical protein
MSREEPMPMWGEHSMSMQEPGRCRCRPHPYRRCPAKPNPDASLDEITSASIPYQSPQGLTGF